MGFAGDASRESYAAVDESFMIDAPGKMFREATVKNANQVGF